LNGERARQQYARLFAGPIVAAMIFTLRADPPQRVVAANLCGEQMLLAPVDPAQIASLSPFAADAELSA
jgi:hypothetical protein